MHPNTRVGSSRGEQMGLGNFQLFRFFTYRHLEHEKVELNHELNTVAHTWPDAGVRRGATSVSASDTIRKFSRCLTHSRSPGGQLGQQPS